MAMCPDRLDAEDHIARVLRALRWGVKTARGTSCRIQVDLRWRLGDEVMALPIYRALCERHPHARVSVLCSYPDLLRDHPFAAPAEPAEEPADRVICLRSGPRGLHRLAHYARVARVRTPAWRPCLYYKDWHTPLLNNIGRPFVVIAPGASWDTKRWDADKWRGVGRAAQDLGYQVVELGHECEQTGVGLSLAGRTSVREAACVLHAARLLVTADSGLMHLGMASGAPVLALFGPTDPDILVRNEPLFHVVRSGLECRGCWNHRKKTFKPGTCPRLGGAVAPGCAPCMQAIAADEVAERLRDLVC